MLEVSQIFMWAPYIFLWVGKYHINQAYDAIPRFRLWDIILKYGQSVFGTHIEMEAWLWLWLAGWLVSGGFVRFFPLIKNISVVCGKPFSFVSSQTIAYCGCLEMYLYRAAIYFVVFCRWPTIYVCVYPLIDNKKAIWIQVNWCPFHPFLEW